MAGALLSGARVLSHYSHRHCAWGHSSDFISTDEALAPGEGRSFAPSHRWWMAELTGVAVMLHGLSDGLSNNKYPRVC